jgi:type I restriction enzyme S subunit
MNGSAAPKEWRRVLLGDVARLQTGLSKSQRSLNDPVVRPYLRVANVQEGRLDLTEVKSIAVERSALARFELRPGDVLMTEGGDFDKLGRGCVWNGQLDGCLHQNHVFAVRPNGADLLPEFLTAWNASSVGKDYYRSCSKQTTNLASINASQVRAAPLLLPPIDEQRRIVRFVAALGKLDDRMAHLKAAKRHFKYGVSQLVFNGKSNVTEWRTTELSEFLEERRERNTNLQLDHILSCTKRGIVAQTDRFARRMASRSLGRYKVARRGDLVFDPMLLWDGSIGFVDTFEVGVVSPAYSVLRVKESASDQAWLGAVLETPQVKHAFRSISKGTNVRRRKADVKDFLAIRFEVPNRRNERTQVGDIHRLMGEEISLLGRLQSALRLQKRTLLDKLVTGELRLPPNE